MTNILISLQLICASVLALSVILLHIFKKNSTLVNTYILQSLGVIALLGIETYQEKSLGILLVTIAMFIVKIIFAPMLFFRLIDKSHQNLSSASYLNVPMTLTVLFGLLVFSQSDILSSISLLLYAVPQLRILIFGSILMSIFIIINRKGAIPQIIGVLSLENSIFAFGIFFGVRQLSALEMGILFDVLFWIIISSFFVTIIYKNFGSLDISKLNQLKK